MAILKVFRTALFGDRPELSEDERRLVLRAMAVIAMPLAVFTTLILLAAGGFAVNELRDRANDNRKAIKRTNEVAAQAAELAIQLNLERANRENALAWQVYDQCVVNENQDASLVALLRATKKLSAGAEPSAALDAFNDALQETIDAREPVDEPDCDVPLRPRPTNAP